MRVLLVTPPMTQLNTPYPATAYLMGFLRLHAHDLGLELAQADASLALFLRLFSAATLGEVAALLRGRMRSAGRHADVPPPIAHFLKHAGRYVETVEPRSASCSAATRASPFASPGARSCPKVRASRT
jgi:hypothetical protein